MNLTTVHSLWLAPLCLALGVGLAWLLYRRSSGSGDLPSRVALLLAVLRAIVVSLIAFLLLEPMVRVMLREVRRPVVVIAHDGSASLLAAGDTAALRGTYARELEALSNRLSERFEVRTFTYGQQVREGLLYDQSEGLTDIAQVLREVYDRLAGPDLGAVIIDGDGIQNRGRDPRMEVTRLGVPVHAIALGDTTVRMDIVLRAVEHNRISYLGNEFPLLARVEARHLRGARTRIAVLHEGRELAVQDISIAADPFVQEVAFSVKAATAGVQRYTISVAPVSGEVTTANNTRDILVEVLDGRQKVLLLGAAPHPDLGALVRSLGGLEGYETTLAYADAPPSDLASYDLVILHRLPSTRMGIQPILQQLAARSIPTCTILGPGMDLAAFNASSIAVQATAARDATTDAQAAMNKEFNAFVLDPELVRAVERFPPLQVPFAQYDLGRAATALVFQRIGAVRTSYPLIAVAQQGERRGAVICGEGLWRWRLADLQVNGTHRHFDVLMHKLVQYLALKVNKNRFRVDHLATVGSSEPVLFDAELYNVSYEPVNTPDVSLVLKDDEGRELPYTFGRSGDRYRLDVGRLAPGRYRWQARTELAGERFTAAGDIYVEELLTEQISTVADHALLADLSARTGGMLVTPDRIEELERAILADDRLVARSYAHASFNDLIGLRWPFFLLLLLLTVEWVLRRRHGSY